MVRICLEGNAFLAATIREAMFGESASARNGIVMTARAGGMGMCGRREVGVLLTGETLGATTEGHFELEGISDAGGEAETVMGLERTRAKPNAVNRLGV